MTNSALTKAFARNDKSWNTVVDVRGGDPLAGNKANEDPLTDNVEMMMLMSDGPRPSEHRVRRYAPQLSRLHTHR